MMLATTWQRDYPDLIFQLSDFMTKTYKHVFLFFLVSLTFGCSNIDKKEVVVLTERSKSLGVENKKSIEDQKNIDNLHDRPSLDNSFYLIYLPTW